MASSVTEELNSEKPGEEDEKEPGKSGLIDIIGTIIAPDEKGSGQGKSIVPGDSQSGARGGYTKG